VAGGSRPGPPHGQFLRAQHHRAGAAAARVEGAEDVGRGRRGQKQAQTQAEGVAAARGARAQAGGQGAQGEGEAAEEGRETGRKGEQNPKVKKTPVDTRFLQIYTHTHLNPPSAAEFCSFLLLKMLKCINKYLLRVLRQRTIYLPVTF